MNISELKLNLIHKIMDMPESTLRNVSELIESSTTDWWDVLTEKERNEIDQGLKESEKQEGIAHEKVMKRFRK